jgi:F-type H+-transporting ATPase subunit alpha
MVATLNQPQYDPWPTEEQVAALYAGINGFLDEVPTAQVPRFHAELREHLRADGSILAQIRETGDLSDETAAKLDEELKRFVKGFHVEEEQSLVAS